MASYTVGIDLGGTKLLSVLFDQSRKVLSEIKQKTPGTQNGDDILALLISNIKELCERQKITNEDKLCIGVAVPGAVNWKNGVVYDTPNIGFKNYPLKELLTKEFSCPVVVENDVNAGAWGEFLDGVAQGYENIVAIFPGTGIGGGMILEKRLYRGSRGAAGEIGHMRVQDGGRLCGCGRYGCLETVASKTALAKDIVALAATGAAPTVFSEAGTDFSKIKSGLIKKSVRAGEAEVVNLVHRLAHYLGIGMANCVNIFDPDVLVLGGGLIEKLGEDIVPRAEESMRAHAQAHIVKDVKVLLAKLGDYSVATGVAALASQTKGKST